MNGTQTLRIGETALTVREIEIDDVERLGRMFNRLSAESVYRRFFSPIHSSAARGGSWMGEKKRR